ncbi:unnamed protein product [Peniophora sp. CBMAI 1063]|nr:unnamed protein product [Peniophora sp. CBMAI 1063]
MSSSDAENGGKRRSAKKQRVPKEGISCDRCRKRKIQCNGRLGGEKCRYCFQNGWQCEYLHAKRKYPVGYVKALEEKIERLLGILRQLHPTEDFTYAVGKPFTEENWPQEGYVKSTTASSQTAFDEPSAFVSPVSQFTLTINLDELDVKAEAESDTEDEQSSKLRNLTDGVCRMSVVAFHGRHSEVNLVRRALDVTYKLTGARIALDDLATFGRPQFWQHRPCEALPKKLSLDFPPFDLLHALAALYFEHQNVYLPLLHQATFMRLISQGRHISCQSFGFLVLAVCANGARYSNDPRILIPGSEPLSAGWYWFNQLWNNFPINSGSSRLYDIQCIALSTIYLISCAATQAGWVWCGHGIRLAQDVGAHRKRVYDDSPTVEDELYRRAFWILILLEKHLGICMARPTAVKDQDLDLDLPNACDDMYWDHPDKSLSFKQPEGRPSRVDILVYHVKLYLAVAPAMCLIFAGSKTRNMVGITEGWERATVANLDSRLNMWAESMPTHLCWDANNDDDVGLLQSAHIWTRYYELQINLHRPFIPSQTNSTNQAIAAIGFPSLSICLSASRAIVRIVDCVQRRFPGRIFPFLHDSAFLAGMMLFIGIWGSSKYGVASRADDDLQGIRTCDRFIETQEARLHTAGRQRDVLTALLSLVEKPPLVAARGQKRTLDETQAPGTPPIEDATAHTSSFISSDEWFAGTQFDATQPLHAQEATIGHNHEGSPWALTNDNLIGAADPLFSALDYHVTDDEYSLPLGDWGFSNGPAYDGPDDFEQLFRSVLGSTG